MRKMLAVAVTLAIGAGACDAEANLVVNGDFTAGGTGWTAFQTANPVTGDSVEVNPSMVYGLPCYDSACVNLEVNANTVDTVVQTINGLTVGSTYTLSWGYGGRAYGGAQQLDISFGDSLLVVDTSDGASPWITQFYSVTATSTSELLSFASQVKGGLASYGNEIADVSLVQAAAVPEPASIVLLGIGGFGLALIRRRAT